MAKVTMNEAAGNEATGEIVDDSSKVADSKGFFELPSYCDLSSATRVKEEILRAVCDVDRLTIDGSRVERMDTSIIQVLVAAHQSFAEENVDVVFVDPSEVMARSFCDLGLAAELDLWGADK